MSSTDAMKCDDVAAMTSNPTDAVSSVAVPNAGDKRKIEEISQKEDDTVSILDTSLIVDYGHHVVLSAGSSEQLWSVTVKKDANFQCQFGLFRHNDLVGVSYGEKVFASKAAKGKRPGFMYLLRPTPELWTRTLGRRTQIIYTRDISMISFALDLKPGCVVVESGTGSGSFSTSLARTVAPTGHLYTYEFHEGRADLARTDFERLGLSSVITVQHCDVLANGFNRPEQSVDAVFLDLPSPEKAIPHAAKVLKYGTGRLCSFSPCIEQVQKTCEALREHRFNEIETVECLLTPIALKRVGFSRLDQPLSAEQTTLLADPLLQRTKREKFSTSAQDIRGHTSYLTFASQAVPVPEFKKEEEKETK